MGQGGEGGGEPVYLRLLLLFQETSKTTFNWIGVDCAAPGGYAFVVDLTGCHETHLRTVSREIRPWRQERIIAAPKPSKSIVKKALLSPQSQNFVFMTQLDQLKNMDQSWTSMKTRWTKLELRRKCS